MNKPFIFHNKIYKDVFTKEELDSLYSVIDLSQTENTSIVTIYGQKAWFVNLPDSIKNKVSDLANKIYGDKVKLEEICFARYSKEYGDFPTLTPHYDNTFKESRVTIDVQLKSNMDWPIVIQDKSFNLQDNEAITFSGTNQIHWREYKEFKDSDFIEMLFCHFSLEDKKPITLEDKQEIEKNMVFYSNRFSMNLIQIINDLKQSIKRYTHE
jgi:hypothetical protein